MLSADMTGDTHKSDTPLTQPARRDLIVRELRRRGLSIRQLARREGVAHQTIARGLVTKSKWNHLLAAEIGYLVTELYPEFYADDSGPVGIGEPAQLDQRGDRG